MYSLFVFSAVLIRDILYQTEERRTGVRGAAPERFWDHAQFRIKEQSTIFCPDKYSKYILLAASIGYLRKYLKNLYYQRKKAKELLSLKSFITANNNKKL